MSHEQRQWKVDMLGTAHTMRQVWFAELPYSAWLTVRLCVALPLPR